MQYCHSLLLLSEFSPESLSVPARGATGRIGSSGALRRRGPCVVQADAACIHAWQCCVARRTICFKPPYAVRSTRNCVARVSVAMRIHGLM